MKWGISSYCLSRLVLEGKMTIFGVLDWISVQGAEHVEIVAGGPLTVDESMAEDIRKHAKKLGLEISNYLIGADFITDNDENFEVEVQRVMREVDIAILLGAGQIRFDVAWRPAEEATVSVFDNDLPMLAEACARVADYAAQYGIITSVENHGYHVQGSERVQRLIAAVNRPNFKLTLDVGNFMCKDEDAVAGVKSNIGIASMIHLKDFYLRPSYRNPGTGWFATTSGNYLRGAIVGQGDIEMWDVLGEIKTSGYDGPISIEFEGLEDCLAGTQSAFRNAQRIWNEV